MFDTWVNQTTAEIPIDIESNKLPSFVGFLFLVGSSLLYGSNYVPVKQFETGDGMFFQFILCLGIWLVGLVVNCIQNFPKFYPLPMLGGFFWATGNVNSVPIIKTIGLGLGLLIWSFVGLVTGWATPRFGLFGLNKDVPSKIALNYVGIVLAAISVVFYLFVKPDANVKVTDKVAAVNADVDDLEVNQTDENKEKADKVSNEPQQKDDLLAFLERQSDRNKRIIGSILAMISGILYGQSSTPALYTNQQFNKNGSYLDMIFSFYTGILVSSIGYFVIYAAILKNNPKIYPKSILPGLISGVMWGIATVCLYMSTGVLNQATSYPIGCSGAPIVSLLWALLFYKEIKGSRNLIFLSTAFVLAIAGSVLIGLSF